MTYRATFLMPLAITSAAIAESSIALEIAQVADSVPRQAWQRPKETLLKDCQDVSNPYSGRDARNGIALLPVVFKHLGRYRSLQRDPYKVYPGIKSELVQEPAHGEVIMASEVHHVYDYSPKQDFFGPDTMVFIVDAFGQRFRVVYSVLVTNQWDDDRERPICKEMKLGSTQVEASDAL